MVRGCPLLGFYRARRTVTLGEYARYLAVAKAIKARSDKGREHICEIPSELRLRLVLPQQALVDRRNAADKIKVGFFATLEGTYTALGEDGQRGSDLALMQHHNKAGGKELEIFRGSSDATPDSAIRAAKKLVEQDKVDILIAPLSGAEGIAVHDYAKTQPQVTFINGCSAALETTYVNPAPNFFRFNLDGAQIHKGLGEYIYNVKHYHKIATIAEDYSFVYTQVFGLALDYCPLGGQITKRIWVPLGTKDFASIISELPDDVDAIYLGLGGADAINFLNQYQQAGGNAKLIGGSIMVDQTVLGSKGKAKEALIGVPSATPRRIPGTIRIGRRS